MDQQQQEQLTTQIEIARNQLNTDRLDVSFGEIMSMYERQEIIIKPAFQRFFRWDIEQRTRFIESVLLGIPVPPIFVAEDKDGVWELVDGLQRISTILSFFGVLKSEDEGIRKNNNWRLIAGDRLEALDGFTYETLPNLFRLNIKRATCRVEILRWTTDYDMRFELFNRLNTGGSPLTPQEVRNCIYRDISTDFNDFIERLAKNQDFIEVVDLSKEQRERLYDQELVLRFMSLYNMSEGDIKTGLAQHMSSFMKKALEQKDPKFDYDKYENLYSNVFKLLKPLGRNIFRNTQNRFTPTRYDIITIGIAENYDRYQSKSQAEIMLKINQIDHDDTITSSGGDSQKGRILKRLEKARSIFGN